MPYTPNPAPPPLGLFMINSANSPWQNGSPPLRARLLELCSHLLLASAAFSLIFTCTPQVFWLVNDFLAIVTLTCQEELNPVVSLCCAVQSCD